MSNRQLEKIRKVFNDTLQIGISCPSELSSRDVLDFCEKSDRLFFYKDSLIAPTRTVFESSECIRIVFALKEGDGGKVQNIERVIQIIKDLEEVLVYIDQCRQTKGDGFIYLDVIKKLDIEQENNKE
jgi:hypothetical protein